MSKTAWWILGIIAVILIAVGVWRAISGSSAGTQAGTNVATTTAATSSEQTAAVNTRNVDTVASVLATLGTSQFNALLAASGVSLSGKGPYTVFVSTNAGYNLLAPGTLARMSAAERKRMIEYSIVSGKALNIDATNNGNIQTLSGDTLNFQVSKIGSVQANSSFALQEYKAQNGVIYVINEPLLPPLKSQ